MVAHTLKDLDTGDRRIFRFMLGVKFAVAVELEDGTWYEVQCFNPDLAKTIANMAVEVYKARGASCWHVGDTGEYGRKPFYVRFWQAAEYGAVWIDEAEKISPETWSSIADKGWRTK